MNSLVGTFRDDHGKERQHTEKVSTAAVANTYNELFNAEDANASKRKDHYDTLVNRYYDLVTDFYEYGWGRCFHFALRYKGESLHQSIARHEHWLAMKLDLKPGQKVLDVGCGVGGPLMEIARFTGAHITGLNNNAYQITRGQKHLADAHLDKTCNFIKGDFMKMDIPDATYDAVYAIEATCHAPSRVGVFSEIFRVLKPGGFFASYEWVTTPKYDPENKHHRHLKHEIEVGDGLPDLEPDHVIVDALRQAGFEVQESLDLANDPETMKRNPVTWYADFEPSLSLHGFKHTSLGQWCTHAMIATLETVRIAPAGSSVAHRMLMRAPPGLLGGGKEAIFTPMFFVLARKPESGSRSPRSPASRRRAQR
jgi:sterol 24-C-methyltransferase